MPVKSDISRNRISRTTSTKPRIGVAIKRQSAPIQYAFPIEEVVPAGVYSSAIVKVENSETQKGKDSVDISYKLSDGKKDFHILQRYGLESKHFSDLCDRLVAAGLPDGSDFSDAVGLKETLQLSYNSNGFGSVVAYTSPTSDDDDDSGDEFEFDDDDEFDFD